MTPSANLRFFDDLKEWSERKLQLIKQYLESSTKILSSYGRVYYLDGFAGRGSYGKAGEVQIPGSPLQAAQLAKEFAASSKPYALRCINVESDRDTFDELERVTVSYAQYVQNISGTFADSIATILKAMGRYPAVCFLDPFGVDGMDWKAVQQLIARKPPTDLWLRFDADEVRRRDGYYRSSLPGADKQFEILTRVYGISDNDKLHQALQAADPEARKERAVELYLQRLNRDFVRNKGQGYSAAYRIGSLQEDIKYYLIFATANKKGLILASNIVYKIEEEYQRDLERYKEHYKASPQMTMFAIIDPSPKEIFEAKVQDITKYMTTAGRHAQGNGHSLTRLDLHALLLEHHFGQIKGPHVTEALRQLVKDGIILSHDGALSDDNTRITFAL
jgi:three-Cys-motif partner protein